MPILHNAQAYYISDFSDHFCKLIFWLNIIKLSYYLIVKLLLLFSTCFIITAINNLKLYKVSTLVTELLFNKKNAIFYCSIFLFLLFYIFTKTFQISESCTSNFPIWVKPVSLFSFWFMSFFFLKKKPSLLVSHFLRCCSKNKLDFDPISSVFTNAP